MATITSSQRKARLQPSFFPACIKILVQEPEQNIGLQLSQQVYCMQWSIKGIKISKVSAAHYNAVGLVKCLLKV